MKPNQLITTMLAATALFVSSCSTQKSAQNSVIQDDVYNSTAKAKEYIAPVMIPYASSSDADDSNYSNSDPNYDMDYSSRIDRFYYGNPNRGYYDPYYNYYGYNSFGYDPFGYSSFYRPFGMGIGLGGYFGNFYNNWYNPYFGWGFNHGMFYGNFWDPFAFRNPYGWGYGGGFGWGGGIGWGGGWGGGVIVRNNENYRPRPNRGGDTRSSGTFTGTMPSRGNATDRNTFGRPNRAENYNPAANGNSRPQGTSSGRPTRTENSRPERQSNAPSRPTYTPPPSNNGGNSSGAGSSSGGGSSRPTRGGGRG